MTQGYWLVQGFPLPALPINKSKWSVVGHVPPLTTEVAVGLAEGLGVAVKADVTVQVNVGVATGQPGQLQEDVPAEIPVAGSFVVGLVHSQTGAPPLANCQVRSSSKTPMGYSMAPPRPE